MMKLYSQAGVFCGQMLTPTANLHAVSTTVTMTGLRLKTMYVIN
jgi:hypothetical protein